MFVGKVRTRIRRGTLVLFFVKAVYIYISDWEMNT